MVGSSARDSTIGVRRIRNGGRAHGRWGAPSRPLGTGLECQGPGRVPRSGSPGRQGRLRLISTTRTSEGDVQAQVRRRSATVSGPSRARTDFLQR